MTKIQLKRGLEKDLPVLAEGEPGFTEDTGKLFIGSPTGNIQIFGNNGSSSIVPNTQSWVSTDNQDTFIISSGSINNIKSLIVFVGGIIQPNITLINSKTFKLPETISSGIDVFVIWFEATSSSPVILQGVSEYEWTAIEGQLSYTLPSGQTYDVNSKWLEVFVGGAPIPDSQIQKDSPTKFTLLIDSSKIKAGMLVFARWTQPYIPATSGHSVTHQLGGIDEIDITKLKNFNEQVTIPLAEKAPIKKVNGFINIAEYNAVGDGVTSDQTAIVNAVADALAKGYALNWGWDGRTYLVTDTIPNFHSVKHIGNTIVKRGSTLFYISPRGTQTNNLYVAPSSPTTNDGLTSDKPVGTIQKAFDYLANYSPVLTGNWQVNLATGTYTKAVLKDALLSENPILLKGPDVGGYPNIPTAIISDGTGISATGIQANKGSVLTIQDVKFTGYNGNSSSNGASCSEASRLYTINCHFTDCYWGVTATHRSYLDVKGGIFDHCGYLNSGSGGGAAIRSLMLVNHYIGDQYGTSLGIEIKNCSMGVSAQELCTGHCNYVDFHDNVDAVRLSINSRCNLDGSSFKRNTRDIRTTDGSAPYITSKVTFASAPDESGNRIVTANGSNPVYDTGVLFGETTSSYSLTERYHDFKYKNQTINSTTATTFYSSTLKAEMWRFKPDPIAIGKKMIFKMFGTITGTAGSKSVTVRFTNGTRTATVTITFASTETGAFQASGELVFNWDTVAANDSQFLYLSGFTSSNTPKISRTVGNVLLYIDSTFSLEGLVANAADSILIDVVQVGWAG